ncbi:MAG TPA: serine/threonine-protein kinase [Thermoanaerobaculia bacterium]|jgi:serine/threonine-protein kinase|nr:serine/threonine-protein kinase [Thermoanaerobaculia bacterium]
MGAAGPMLGRRVGSWVLEKELGQGGMGSVFQARHASLSTLAAVKVLSPGLESEESFRQRFRREAELQAQLRHPNVARVLDYLEDSGQWFLVIEYLDRGSLADVLSQEKAKVPRQQAVTWADQALAGLGYAHQKGIVHRDVKPANLLLNENGEVVVADFGIARADSGPGLTTTGIAIGTPQYMSPEQILTPDQIDRRSDIYSMGVVLYELLTGRKPFDSGSQFSVLQAHVTEPPPPLRGIDPSISPALEAVVMRALAKKPEDRYPACDALIRDLDLAASVPEGNQALVRVPVGATVRASSLTDPSLAPRQLPSASPAEVNTRRRRSFQRRLVLGALAVLAIAALLAFLLSRKTPDPIPPSPPPPVVTPKPTPPVRKPTRIPIRRPVPAPSPFPFPTPRPDPVATPRPVPVPTPEPAPTPLPVLALPEHPKVAVIAGGDPLLAGVLEQEMERRLGRRFDVADEHGDPDVDQLLRREGAGVSQKALGTQLVRSGFHVLILLRVEEAERRRLEIQGVSGSLKAARIRMNAYLLPVNRSIGRGWTELVEYTELSASTKAKQAFIGPTADLIQDIDSEWTQLRAAAPAH